MLGKNSFRKFITLMTVAAVWCVYSSVAFAMPNDLKAELTVTGQVSVNGQPAVSSSTILSGATIVTGDNSSAVVGWPWLIAIAAGVAGVGLWLGTKKSDTTLSGGAIIVSPTR